MNDAAHAADIYAHAECDSRCDDAASVFGEGLLHMAAFIRRKAGMVAHGLKPGVGQHAGSLLRSEARIAVYDDLALAMLPDGVNQCGIAGRRDAHGIAEVFAQNRKDHLLWTLQFKTLANGADHDRVSCGCHGTDNGTHRQRADKLSDSCVCRTEGFAPAHDAVSLVHGDHGRRT